MCDQTEVEYSPGDVVWVKLGPVWWPGQVQDYEALPEEITANLRKKPIAVVKFFQEESFEYVKNLDHIYSYNCQKKEEFIKKGLDMVRSANSREVPSNMKMFPNDIATAEHLTGGDPNILNRDAFAPPQKRDYSDLFGTKKSSGKKGKKEPIKREQDTWKSRSSNSSMLNERRSLPSTIPRPITHPRFITKALEGRSDHEVRIRYQANSLRDSDGCSPSEKKYRCHICNYETVRLNVIVLHNKSHSAGFISPQTVSKPQVKKESKAKENVTPTITLLGDQTPTTTSRGRVKCLPKKLMDYTDEPPAKIMKEKIYVKSPSKEVVSTVPKQVPTENLPPVTPKPEKEEKVSIKRPLFGKRKTAKEKAEIAAKQKQENEAMKETLLKDWDDDDVNEEEVELEQLKQALESTTASDPNDDSVSVTEKVPSPSPQKESPLTRKKSLVGGAKIDVKNDIKAKVFDFDDSEDSLPVHISFRQKSKPEKFTDDKFKKPKPPKPLRVVSKSKAIPKPPHLVDSKKEEDAETAQFNEAFNALLEETVVPLIPDIPKGAPSSKTTAQNSDQTSDISSSTDLMEVDAAENLNLLPQKVVIDAVQDNNVINDDLHMECTSSDSEEIKSSDHNNALVIQETQKNFKEISTGSPRVEVDSDSLSGVATTTTDSTKHTYDPSIVAKGLGSVSEESVVTEISSTCDVAKRTAEESRANVEKQETSNLKIISPQTITETIYNCLNEESTNVNKQAMNTESFSLEEVKNDEQLESVNIKTNNISAAVKLSNKDSPSKVSESCFGLSMTSDSNIVPMPNEMAPQSEQGKSLNFLTEFKLDTLESGLPYTNDEPFKDISNEGVIKENEVVKEETITMQHMASNVIEEKVVEYSMTEQNEPEYIIPEHALEIPSAVQLTLPSETHFRVAEQPQHQTVQEIAPKMEISETCQLGTQNLSQNLQDMELDINSMPVIIGGEDFIQAEPPKPPVPIQPKYTESIVISPKRTSSKANKSDSVIMHLGEPSTSNKNFQSVISIPSKTGKGGTVARVKVPKTTTKTIKLPASALKSLGSLQKGGNQQVLILKTTSQKGKQPEKGVIHPNKGPLNMFQHGNKILIVNNPQMSGQNKIRLNPQQQQLLTGGKLAPGTRVFTSKVVATTTAQNAASSNTGPVSKPTQKLVISKGGLITSSKSVIINNSPSKFVTTLPGTQSGPNTKGQTLIAHNILNTKGGLVLSNSSQSASSPGKTATIITSQALATSKGMILTPITSKGGTIISGNQKLRIVSSKAPMSGTKLVVQKTQKKIALDPQKQGQMKVMSGMRGSAAGPTNTILIQTSQGLVAKSVPTSTISTNAQPAMKTAKTVMTTIPTQAKIRMTTALAPTPILPQPVQPKTVQPPPKKVGIQKIRPGPNILQKTQRKSTPRTPRSSNRFISPVVPKTEPIMLSTTSNLPVIAQPTIAQGQIPQNTEGLVYLTMDEAGNYRQIDNKSLITFEGNPAEAPQTIFIPANSQADVSNMNIFLAIDDAGNIVNITQPPANPTFPTETAVAGQDILAKALANTQVLQQETMPDVDVTTPLSSVPVEPAVIANSSFTEQAHYPAPPISRSVVLETSLTLNQAPIMTPLEVPSAVSPNLSQISPLSSNYISPDLLTTKQKHIRPSMPLLTEESLQAQGEPVFLLDSSNNLVPATSGSQISFQLLSDNNMIVASGGEVLPPSYEVITSNVMTSHQLIPSGDTVPNSVENISSVPVESHAEDKSVAFSVIAQGEQMSDSSEGVHQSVILREALEAPKPCKSESPLENVEEDQNVSLADAANLHEYVIDEESYIVQNTETVDNQPEKPHEMDELNSQPMIDETEVKHSLKRTLGEDQAVTSSSDPKDSAKRIRIDER